MMGHNGNANPRLRCLQELHVAPLLADFLKAYRMQFLNYLAKRLWPKLPQVPPQGVLPWAVPWPLAAQNTVLTLPVNSSVPPPRYGHGWPNPPRHTAR